MCVRLHKHTKIYGWVYLYNLCECILYTKAKPHSSTSMNSPEHTLHVILVFSTSGVLYYAHTYILKTEVLCRITHLFRMIVLKFLLIFTVIKGKKGIKGLFLLQFCWHLYFIPSIISQLMKCVIWFLLNRELTLCSTFDLFNRKMKNI